MKINFVNWWKYWEKGSHEMHWIWLGITTSGFMEFDHYIRIDLHLFNFGIIGRI